jgi:cation diffusion facilitator CzcD-associated flavoprotein CzcO
VTPANTPKVVVIGAGPVGLAAATHLVEDGADVTVLEAGDEVGSSIRTWGHVRLFSPWRYTIDAAAARALSTTGWQVPDLDRLPTGNELVDQYLTPLAATPQMRGRVRLGSRVTAVSRMTDKVRDDRTGPFLVRFTIAAGVTAVAT